MEGYFYSARVDSMAALQNRFLYRCAIDERSVGGTQIPDDDILVLHVNLAVVTGYRWVGDLKVVRRASPQ
jgi:hypothetical protein